MLPSRGAGAGLVFAALLLLSSCGDSDNTSAASEESAEESEAGAEDSADTAAEDNETADSEDTEAAADDPETPPDTAVPPLTDADATFVAEFDDGPAADVEGTEIPAEDLFGELTDQLAAQESSTGTTGNNTNDDGDFEANLASSVLSELIVSELVVQEIDARGLEVSEEAIAEVQAGVGPAPEGVDESFVEQFVLRQAQYQVLAGDLFEESGSATDVLECSRHVLLETEAEAEDVIDRLESGEDFAAVAADASTDPSAAQNGGSLGCDVSSFVPVFAEAVQALSEGERSEPVESDFGFHVIEKVAPTAEEIEAGSQTARQTALRDWIVERVAAAEVTVDERIGTWDAVSGVVAIGTPDPEEPEILDESLADN